MSYDDEARFDELWRTHHAFLLAYAQRRLHSMELAQEAVAEAFGNAWLHRKKVPSGSQARLWLTKATFHALSNIKRKAERDTRLVGRLIRERPNVDSTVWPDSFNDAQVRLMRAIDQLQEHDRELIRLANWERFDQTQIATIMGMSPGNVAVRLHRARLKLRELLAQDMSGAASTTRGNEVLRDERTD